MRVTKWAAFAAAIVVSAITAASVAAAAPSVPFTDGSVTSLVASAGRVYVGGGFRYLGPYTGSLARFDGTTGTSNGTLPLVDGPVMTTISDGVGGWYIGGAFTAIAGQAHGPLAHIRADGSVDPGFNPYPNAPVASLALANGKLYVGGYFTIIAGVGRNKMAALDPVTGGIDGSFDANVSGGSGYIPSSGVRPQSGPDPYYAGCYGSPQRAQVPGGDGVYAILPLGNRLIIGGSFTYVGSTSRLSIAAVDANSGALDATFNNSNPDGAVFSLAAANGKIYLGGDFRQVGGLSRSRIAALDATSGAVDTQFQAAADGRVNAIVPGPDRLYVGGTFTHIGGQTENRLAALNLSTGVPSGSFPGADWEIASLLLSGDHLYVTGGFEHLGTTSRHYFGAINVRTNAVDTGFVPAVDDVPGVLAGAGSNVLAAGAFDSSGGAFRPGVAAVSPSTGLLDDGFTPGIGRLHVDQLLPAAGRLYAVLDTGSYPQKVVIASLDPATGAVDPNFKPPAMSTVPSIASDGKKLYVVRGRIAARKHALFALNLHTGALDAKFKPNDDGNDAVVYGNRVIVAGSFYTGQRIKTRYGTVRRHIGLRAFDKRTGQPLKNYGAKLPWPRYNGDSPYVFLDGKRIYFEGLHSRGISAINAATGRLIPSFNGPRGTILSADASRIYLEGGNPVAIRKSNGSRDAGFKIDTNGNVCALEHVGTNFFVGGGFGTIAGVWHPNFGMVSRP